MQQCVYKMDSTLSDVADAVRVRESRHDERARVHLHDGDAVVPDASEEPGHFVERAKGLHEPVVAPDDATKVARAEHVRPAAIPVLLITLSLAAPATALLVPSVRLTLPLAVPPTATALLLLTLSLAVPPTATALLLLTLPLAVPAMPAALLLLLVPSVLLLVVPALLHAPGMRVPRPVLLAPLHAPLKRAPTAPVLLLVMGGRNSRGEEKACAQEEEERDGCSASGRHG